VRLVALDVCGQTHATYVAVRFEPEGCIGVVRVVVATEDGLADGLVNLAILLLWAPLNIKSLEFALRIPPTRACAVVTVGNLLFL